jgi:rSAM/selenodomain-associated transferase 1
MSNTDVLLIFVKAPHLGQVKNRLQPGLSALQSLSLHKAMAEDLITRFRDVPAWQTKVAFWPQDARSCMQKWLGDHLEFVPQQGEDLGHRMSRAFEEQFQRGHEKVLIVGCDLPGLETEIISQALEGLSTNDLILGPNEDGGYYLIGLKQAHPELFRDVDWSTDRVLKQTLDNARAAHLAIRWMAVRSDIDTYQDVRRLWRHLNKLKTKGAPSPLPSTYHTLERIFV